MRLDKFLVETRVGSRTEVKALLKKRQVSVNGEVETSPKRHINEETDTICFNGEVLAYQTFVYYLLNKPQGVISATEDPAHRTVLDLLAEKDRKKGIFPVGRLDKDTRGLLLLTNNGPLAHAMLSPKKHVDKLYEAQVEGIMTLDDVERFAQGIELSDHRCQPAILEIVAKDKGGSTVRITIKEGKFHQVKRMVAACGKRVVDLKRLSMGPLALPESLAEGDYRALTEEELANCAVFGVPL